MFVTLAAGTQRTPSLRPYRSLRSLLRRARAEIELLDHDAVVVHGLALLVLVPVLLEPAGYEELGPYRRVLGDDPGLLAPGRGLEKAGLLVRPVVDVVGDEEGAQRVVVFQLPEDRGHGDTAIDAEFVHGFTSQVR